MARIAGNEARAPRVEVRNRSDRSIRYLEIGWILQDQAASFWLDRSGRIELAPGQKSQILENTTLKFPQPHGGQPLAIDGMTGFRQQRRIYRRQRLDSQPRRSRNAAIAARRRALR